MAFCPFDITPHTLPDIQVGVAYSTDIVANHGLPPYTFSPPSNAYGEIPILGLTWNQTAPDTYNLSGVPYAWAIVITGMDTQNPETSIFSPCVMGTQVWTFAAAIIRCGVSSGPIFKSIQTPCTGGPLPVPVFIDNINDSLLVIKNKLLDALRPEWVGRITFDVLPGITDPCSDPGLTIMPVKIIMYGIGKWCLPAGVLQVLVYNDFCQRYSTSKTIGATSLSFNLTVVDDDACETTENITVGIIPDLPITTTAQKLLSADTLLQLQNDLSTFLLTHNVQLEVDPPAVTRDDFALHNGNKVYTAGVQYIVNACSCNGVIFAKIIYADDPVSFRQQISDFLTNTASFVFADAKLITNIIEFKNGNRQYIATILYKADPDAAVTNKVEVIVKDDLIQLQNAVNDFTTAPGFTYRQATRFNDVTNGAGNNLYMAVIIYDIII